MNTFRVLACLIFLTLASALCAQEFHLKVGGDKRYRGEDASTVTGKVVFENTDPKYQKIIRLRAKRTQWPNDSRIEGLKKDGSFTFEDLKPGVYYLASEDTEAYPVVAEPGTTDVGEFIFGHDVFHTTGTAYYNGVALKGGKITARPLEAKRSRCIWPAPTIETEIQENGAYDLRLLERGMYALQVWPDREKRPDAPRIFELFENLEPGDEPLDLNCPVTSLRVKVDTQGKNVSLGQYRLISIARSQPALAAPQHISHWMEYKNGEFRLDHLPNTDYDLALLHDPFASGPDLLGSQWLQNVVLMAGENEVRFPIRDSHTVDVRIDAPFPDPLALNVIAVAEGNLRLNWHSRLFINREGRERDEQRKMQLGKGRYIFMVGPYDPDYTIDSGPLELNRDIILTAHIRKAGQVRVRLTGEKKDGRTVRIFDSLGEEVHRLLTPEMAESVRWHKFVILPTDPMGMTDIYCLAPGDYTLQVDGSDVQTPVQVKVGETTLAEVQLEQ